MWKLGFSALAGLAIAACASTKPSVRMQQTLDDSATATLGEMRSRDPGLDNVLRDSYAYVVFPNIGAAGAGVVGGAYGRGVVYEHGRPIGYAKLEQGSLGAELGGQTFAELLVLRNQHELDLVENGKFDMGANATAVVLTAGASAQAEFNRGRAVFVMPHGGLMAGVSLSGQRIVFEPAG